MEIVPASEVFTIAMCRCNGLLIWGPLTRNESAISIAVPATCPTCDEAPTIREARLEAVSLSGFLFAFGQTRYDSGPNANN